MNELCFRTFATQLRRIFASQCPARILLRSRLPRFLAYPSPPPPPTSSSSFSFRSTPEVAVAPLDTSSPADAGAFLLLACDGVWDHLSTEEAVAFVATAVARAGGPARASAAALSGVADQLKDHVLSRAAASEGMSVDMIRSLRAGKSGGDRSRRNFHDDITAVIVFFGPAYRARGGAGVGGGAEKKSGGWGLW